MTAIIYVDADACPVKAEVCRVAARHACRVILVANSWMRVPEEWNAQLEVVDDQFDAADDRIISRIKARDIVVTADIPLADRAIKAGAFALDPRGRIYSEKNIANLLATRNLMQSLRSAGEVSGGPAAFGNADRSAFLQSLEKIIQSIKHSA